MSRFLDKVHWMLTSAWPQPPILCLLPSPVEVTGGGVPLNELDCSTLESRRLPGVHVCGELCDVFGRIGGFNFYWAWVSGRLSGLAAAEGAAAAPPASVAAAEGA